MRFIVPIILLIISIASFVMFTNPSYQRIKDLKEQNAQYSEALGNSRKLQEQRDALGQKYHAIPVEQLSRLMKFLPDTADNIRLIIDIQRIAQTYGLSLSAIKYDAKQPTPAKQTTGAPLAAASPTEIADASNDYGTFNLEFTVSATYENFLKFLKDMESSLRLVDVQSITFTSDTATPQNGGKTQFTVKFNTYWLKS